MKEDFAVLPLPAEPAPASRPPDAVPPPQSRVNPFTLFLILILLLGATEQLARAFTETGEQSGSGPHSLE
jgi:hypothetical protein